jgi:hypothetical protein
MLASMQEVYSDMTFEATAASIVELRDILSKLALAWSRQRDRGSGGRMLSAEALRDGIRTYVNSSGACCSSSLESYSILKLDVIRNARNRHEQKFCIMSKQIDLLIYSGFSDLNPIFNSLLTLLIDIVF